MAKGTIKGSFSGTSASNVYPQIEWSSSSSIANNTSSVTAVLYFVRASSYWKSYNLSGHSVAISINGNSSSANRKFDLRSTSKYEVWHRTVTVAHGSDGKKSITIKASSGSTGISLGSYSVSGTATLDTIPRATQPSVASTSAMGTNVTLNLPRANSSFTHTVKYSNAGHDKTWTGVGASLTYNFPVDEWAQKIQKSTSNGGIWTVTTYNGSQNLGTKSVSMRLTIPDSVVPTTSNFTIADGNAKAQAVLGDGTNFVQRVSVLNVSITASGVSGSWITTSETVIGGKTYTGTANSGRSVSINLNELSGLVGTQAVKVRTKDSRGRWSGYVTQSFNIWAYASPTINAAIERVNNTTQIKFTKSAKVSSIVIGNVEKNTYTAKTEYKVSTDTTWSTAKTETNAFVTVTIDGFAIDKSYDIRLTLTDKFTSTSTTTTISTSKVLLDFYRDTGVGIGKLYEPGNGVLDVGGDITADDGLLRINNTHSVYASPNMQDWLMNDPATKAIVSMNYANDGTNELTLKGVGGVEYFSQPIHTVKDQPISVTFEYTQPAINQSSSDGGVWVYFLDQPFAGTATTTGIVKPGLGAMTNKTFTVNGTGNGETMYLVFRTGGVADGIQYNFKVKIIDEQVSGTTAYSQTALGAGALSLSAASSSGIGVGGSLSAYDLSMMNLVGSLLWTGYGFMTDVQTITPSMPMSKCLNGWVLTWSKYADGAPNEAEFVYTYIPKFHGSTRSGRGVSCVVPDFNGGKALNKYLYVTDTTLKGNAKNDDGELAGYVMREVRAW